MKSFVAFAGSFLVCFVVSSADAKIENSSLELRHQELIEKAVEAKCQIYPASFVEVSTLVAPIRIDQGVTDYKYETVLQFKVRVDQMIFDTYEVTVSSAYTAAYDHASQAWGLYEIEAVSNCNQL